jgi:hypothetical protein
MLRQIGWRFCLMSFDVIADIEQPLPGRNLIYLAYFLPKELEELSS